MSHFTFKRWVLQLWKIICISATLFTTIYQLNEYFNGPQRTTVEYKKFNKMDQDVYPSIGICTSNTLMEKNLKHYGDDVTSKNYAEFLYGLFWNQSFLEIDYEYVTRNIEEYLVAFKYKTNDWKIISIYDSETQKGVRLEEEPWFTKYSFFNMKCFGIDIPFLKNEKILGFYITLKSSIFRRGIRLDNPSEDIASEDQFILIPHYPKQLARGIQSGRRRWPTRKPNAPKSYMMAFNVLSVDVVQKLNTHQAPCLERTPDYETHTKKSILDELGCAPPYWNSSSSFAMCSTHADMIQASHLTLGTMQWGEEKTCRSFENIVYSYEDIERTKDVERSTITLAFEYNI